MENKNETILVAGGNEGKVYEFPDFENIETQIPGDYSSTSDFNTDPNSHVIFKGLLLFAVYDKSAGNPFPNGVYSYGSKDIKNFPKALNMEYVISPDKTTGIEIGAISTNGTNLFVAWKDGSTYGMDIIDFSNKYASAFIEFLMFTNRREIEKEFVRFPCAFDRLPASCTIELKQAVSRATSFTSVATVSVDNDTDDDEQFEYTDQLDKFLIKKKNKDPCCSRQCWSKLNISQLKLHLGSLDYVSRLVNRHEVKKMIMLVCYCNSLPFKVDMEWVGRKKKRTKRKIVEFRVPSFDRGFCKQVFLQLFDVSERSFYRWKLASGGVRSITPPVHGLVGAIGR